MRKGLEKLFDLTYKYHSAQGAATANAQCAVTGEMVVTAEVAKGEDGLACGQVIGTKLFRVKPGDGGETEIENAWVEVSLSQHADISGESNQYHINYCVTFGEWLPEDVTRGWMGTPSFIDANPNATGTILDPTKLGHNLPGMLFRPGLFQRAFWLHPTFKRTVFPMGPAYRGEDPLITFNNCHLIAGHTYGVQVSVTVSIIGQPPDAYGGPMGGSVFFDPLRFFVNGISVKSG